LVKTEVDGYFTIAEATQYFREQGLALSERAVYYHVFTSKRLPGQMRLGRRTFTKAELDAFLANPPRRGNPTSKPRRQKVEKAASE
jgi:hypothetical protein